MSAKEKPVCQSGPIWLKEVAKNLWSRIGLKESCKRPLAPLTGQDYKAYSTFLHALELYNYSDGAGSKHALACMQHAVMAMQPHTQWIARATIPHLLDWGDQQTMWPKIVPAEKVEAVQHMASGQSSCTYCGRTNAASKCPDCKEPICGGPVEGSPSTCQHEHTEICTGESVEVLHG